MAGRPLIVIAGPTASGKSQLALTLAEQTGGTIINADSMQVYRDLCILTARPDPADQARAPHRLFGHIDGAEACSAARWANEAKAVLATVDRPILVGGSGLYLRTLLDGIAPVPEIDAAVRAEVRALPVAASYARLATIDPAAAARLRPTDTSRVARALEVMLATGRSIADWQTDAHGGIAGDYAVSGIVLTPARDALFERIGARARAMVRDARSEVARLMERALDPTLPVMRAIGVAAYIRYFNGAGSLDDVYGRIVQDTRRYAKRQDTWFRHQAPAAWPRTEDPGTGLASLRLVIPA